MKKNDKKIILLALSLPCLFIIHLLYMLLVKRLMYQYRIGYIETSFSDLLAWFYLLALLGGLTFFLFFIYAILADKKKWINRMIKKIPTPK